MKLLLATKVKFALLSALISLAFVPQAFAVLRPLFPAKPTPPFNGELVIVGDDSVMGSARKHMLSLGSGTVAIAQTQRHGR